MNNKLSIPINSEHDIFIARQQGRQIAEELGFRTIDLALIATAISELTRNIITYASQGIIVIEFINQHGKSGISITAQDKGPGIKDLEMAMQDGFSTAGSLGLGLPGVQRLMDWFEIQSQPGKGTRVFAKKWLPQYD